MYRIYVIKVQNSTIHENKEVSITDNCSKDNYLGINLRKYIENLCKKNYKILMKENYKLVVTSMS